ncbi:MAG TPA: TetR/AcrR family transcriptional regulator [Candidatus Didemnitutus sp.]|nr:TetR/AcrR family transcriptional regulator [Candidatus Didemnitutus sp.]
MGFLVPTAPSPSEEPAARIRAAARARLFADGYRALHMSALARELGLSKKTLYRHFESKDAIIAALIDDLNRDLRRDLEAILGDPNLRFAARLRAVMDRILPTVRLLTPSLLAELAEHAPALCDQLDRVRRENIPRYFGRLIRIGIAEGRVRPGVDPDFAVQFWLQAIRGLLHPEVVAATGIPPAESVARALRLFAGGLLTPAAFKDHEKSFAA